MTATEHLTELGTLTATSDIAPSISLFIILMAAVEAHRNDAAISPVTYQEQELPNIDRHVF